MSQLLSALFYLLLCHRRSTLLGLFALQEETSTDQAAELVRALGVQQGLLGVLSSLFVAVGWFPPQATQLLFFDEVSRTSEIGPWLQLHQGVGRWGMVEDQEVSRILGRPGETP